MTLFCHLLLLGAVCTASAEGDVLVTGATGRTGRLIYERFKAARGGNGVRALVRNLSTAAAVLNCSACDASEGIFLADVTEPASLQPAFAGVSVVAIAVGETNYSATEAQMEAVEYTGVMNQVFCWSSQTGHTV
jgi:uncharacterized protein YbjT (DUF2867 family)